MSSPLTPRARSTARSFMSSAVACLARWEAESGRRVAPATARRCAVAWTLSHLASSERADAARLGRVALRALPESELALELFDVLEQSPGDVPEWSAPDEPVSRAELLGVVHSDLLDVDVDRSPVAEWSVVLAPTARRPAPEPITESEWLERGWDAQVRLLVDRTGRSAASIRAMMESDRPPAALSMPDGWAAPGALRLRARLRNPELGAHYTPRVVVEEVVEAVLEPILTACSTASEVLAVRVCDPAVGTGAFLCGAVKALAAAVVSLDSDRWTLAEAREQVVSACIYGVDLDPMAVGLTRVVLLVLAGLPDAEAVEAHVRHGDAVVGLSPTQVDCGHWDPGAAPMDPQPLDVHRQAWADAVVATLCAEDTPRRRLRALRELHSSGPGQIEWHVPVELARRWPQHAAGGALRPLHWAEAFPEVFDTAASGFDVVLANPPYRSARSVDSAARRAYRDALRVLHPGFAVGAFDLSTVFWSRLVGVLLSRRGRYGMVVPTASLSSSAPWQERVQAAAPPDQFILYPVDQFPRARVRTTGVIGGRQPLDRVRVVDWDGAAKETGEVERQDMMLPWYINTRLGERAAPISAPTVSLGQVVQIRAGCATDAAYQLAPAVVEDARGTGLRLMTTGAIDRYRSHWGLRPIRFLGRQFDFPRWPDAPDVSSVQRALEAQCRPKILVAGLTAVLEAWMDADGSSAGVVSTWVLVPQEADRSRWLWAVLGIVNSAVFSQMYMARHGGAAMSGRQTTIKKSALREMPVPSALVDAVLPGNPPPPFVPWEQQRTDLERVSLLASLVQRAQATPPGPEFRALDLLSHGLAAALYGHGPSEAVAGLDWWWNRSRGSPESVDWSSVVRRLSRVVESGSRPEDG